MRKINLFFYLGFVFNVVVGHALALDPAKGKTEFLAIGRPSALKIKGLGQGPGGDLQFSKREGQVLLNGEANVDLSTLDSGIGMRDRHMKEKYLETEKFKQAVLKFKDASLPESILQTGGEVHIPATLSLHGQEKPVDVRMTITANSGKITSASRFRVKLSEYAIEIPKFSGITVADEVEINVDTEVQAASVTGSL